jgi:hypothetical protein
MLAGLPSSIKNSASDISCGSTDPIEEYRKIIDPDPDPEPPDPNPTEGICCALKITGKEELRGDYEDYSNKTCEQIWTVGREVYGGEIEYSLEIEGLSRYNCEKWWDGTCCKDSGEYEWVPLRNCSKKATDYKTYKSCIEANEEPEEEMVCCLDSNEYEWKEKGFCNNIISKYQAEDSCLQANGREATLKLNLDKGYNFVAINASDSSDPLTASKLLNSPAVILVASFKDGVWNRIMYREDGHIKGANFNLEKGNAYLITATTDFEMQYSGRTFTEFSWDYMRGWQFVPAKALDPYSDTKSVVLSFDTVDITQVGLWNRGLGKFDYYVYDISGNEYGESVRLNENQGVFVKID